MVLPPWLDVLKYVLFSYKRIPWVILYAEADSLSAVFVIQIFITMFITIRLCSLSNPFHILKQRFFEVCFNIIFNIRLRLFNRSFQVLRLKFCKYVSFLRCVLHVMLIRSSLQPQPLSDNFSVSHDDSFCSMQTQHLLLQPTSVRRMRVVWDSKLNINYN
jgi:hypothetical protein